MWYWYEIYFIAMVVHVMVYYRVYKKIKFREIIFYIKDFNYIQNFLSTLSIFSIFYILRCMGSFKAVSHHDFMHMIIALIIGNITWGIVSTHPAWQEKIDYFGSLFDKFFR